MAGSGYCSWHEFAREVVTLAGIAVDVEPITTAELGRPAKRPAFSALASERPIPRLPHWAEGVAEVVDRLTELG
jgi:dTDP-4-dehydrorhamnose reductase